jgi:uncharacterized membrane protein
MSLLHQLVTVAAPWADFYNGSKVAQTAVSFGHFGGMMTAGGFALAADRATLRAAAAAPSERGRRLQDLAESHPIVLSALAVTTVSGLLMLAADLESLVQTPAFWIKMGLVVLLLANGWRMLRAERALRQSEAADARAWNRLRLAAMLSLLLWFAVVLAGAVLPNVT